MATVVKRLIIVGTAIYEIEEKFQTLITETEKETNLQFSYALLVNEVSQLSRREYLLFFSEKK